MLLLGLFLTALAISRFDPNDFGEQIFEEFIHTYDKVYASADLRSQRYQIFLDNLVIAKHLDDQDADPNGARFGVTEFSDLTAQEFREMYLMSNFTIPDERPQLDWVATEPKNLEEEASFDWSQKGKTTPVYNQGSCGSCWAFSVVEQLESMWAIAGHPLTKLSMQQLVDCDKCSHGCGGGLPSCAWPYIQRAGGVDTYASYPYSGANGACRFNPGNVAARFKSWGYVTTSRSEPAMKNYLLSTGPISVCVDATQWQHYKSGVLKSCARNINHCVQLTGFDTATNAWNIRNSWGTGWGQAGYMLIAFGGDLCGIAQVATSVTI